jgi:glycerol-3-phosphate acyltransferase PlsY
VRAVAVGAGICVIAGYLLGTVPVGDLVTRRRFRRDLRQLDDVGDLQAHLRTLLAGSRRSDLVAQLLVATLDTLKVVGAATLAWQAMIAVSPGGTATRANQSAVGFLADQVLTSWESIALWTGLAAVAGHVASPWLQFRGDQGQAPALGLAIVYSPLGFSTGVAVFFLAFAVVRRPRAAVLTSLAGFATYTWLAWTFDWQLGWGVTNGPELTLWSAALAAVIAAVNLRQ